MKKQFVLFKFPNMTTNKFDQCWDELHKKGIDSPPGLIHHVAAQMGNTLIVADVWESAEAFNKFGETLNPIFTKLGIPQVKPEIAPVHYELSREAHYES